MKTITQIFFQVTLFIIPLMVTCQSSDLSLEYKTNAIERLSDLMNDHYVFPDVAKKTEQELIAKLKSGYFTDYKTKDAFANALTEVVQSINKDKHMRVWKNRVYETPENSPQRTVEEMMDQLNRSRRNNLGFNTVKILEGNVGYLDLRGFAGLESGKELADASMKILSRADAIIFDLSKNGGGSPRMVQYLCSYFFDKKTHLNSLYWRSTNETEEFWTLDKVGGNKIADIPLFVIISNRTFSGAEEFSYNMQTQKRATLIGQTSGGGANPGGSMPINEHLSVFIPTGRAINPITKTNWEGVGVIPDIKSTVEDTYDKTIDLAKDAAEDYRREKKAKFSKLYLELHDLLINYPTSSSSKSINDKLLESIESDVLNENRVNTLGYQFLLEYNKSETALLLFEANINYFPESANTYDSYAEALMLTGNYELALINYQTAVKKAKENRDGNLELFENNLLALKEKLKEKK